MKKFFRSTYFAIVLLFIYVPIAVMVVYSFNGGDNTIGSITSWSSKWYGNFAHNKPFIDSIVTSLFVAVVSTVISLIIGVMAAIGLSKCKKVTQNAWYSIANIPLINADVVTAVSLMMVFMLSGIRFGIGTLLLAHISFNVPYVLITVMPRLKKVDPAMIEASQDLGAKPYQTLFKVILPVLRPAIVIAAVICFAMSFDDFIISYFTGGPQTNVSTFMYTAKKIRPYIYAFGTILVGVIAFFVIGWNVYKVIKSKKEQTKEQIKKGYYKSEKIDKLSEKLNKDYIILNTGKELVKSRNPFVWIHMAYLKMLIKLYSIRNFDKKISKLEWKQYKIRNEIRNEKRYVSRLAKVNKSITKLQKEIVKNKADLAKIKKLNKRLDDLDDKKAFLESEIEWMNNRDEKASIKVKKIQKQIRHLQREMKKEGSDLSKKDLAWYRKKIKNLEEYKLEVEEGKAHYKLRMTTERLVELKELRNNKIYELEDKLNKAKAVAYVWKPIGWKYEKSIAKTKDTNKALHTAFVKAKNSFVEKNIAKLQTEIISTENKLEQVNNKVALKQDKLLSSDDDRNVKPKNWLQRTWKILAVLLVGAGAFSGLTTAYVINNTYDITIGNWGEYIDPTLITDFKKETGIKVNYQVYDSNESLYDKLYTFDYDLMIPSDYMVQKLATQKKIQKINWEDLNINRPKNVPGMDYDKLGAEQAQDNGKESIAPQLVKLMNTSTINVKNDETGATNKEGILNYAVPYFWGDLIIVFNNRNTEVQNYLSKLLSVDQKEIATNDSGNLNTEEFSKNVDGFSWDEIRKISKQYPDLRLALPNDAKNLFMIADEVQNGRVNFKDKNEINKAKDYIKDLINGDNRKNVVLRGDDMLPQVREGNFDVAVMYAGDYYSIASDIIDKDGKKPYSFVRPWSKAEDGSKEVRTNIYSDSMVVSSRVKKDSKKYKDVYKFIDFMYEKKSATKNSDYVGLASPNMDVLNSLAEDAGDLANLYKPVLLDDKYKLPVPRKPDGSIIKDPTDEEKNLASLAFQYNDELDSATVNAYNEVTSAKIF